MPDLTLYLGGTRSGKSLLAEQDALQAGHPVLYVATAGCRDGDRAWAERVRRHRERRPKSWRTLECERNLAPGIEAELARLAGGRITAGHEPAGMTVLIDCATLWVTNILCALPDPENALLLEEQCEQEVAALLALVHRLPCHWIVVSGETGLGGIAATAMARSFCDALGLVNQRLAAQAKQCWLCVAGKKLLLSD